MNDTHFESFLPSGVQLVDHVTRDDVAIAGQSTDDDILLEVLQEDHNHCSDDDSQDELT